MAGLPTLHLIGIFHTIPSQAFSHCAFTGKALRFPRMMQAQGFDVIEYANEGSEAGASEHVQILTAEEHTAMFGSLLPVELESLRVEELRPIARRAGLATLGRSGRKADLLRALGSCRQEQFHGDQAVVGSAGHALFESRLREEMERRVQPGDVICHPFGHAHEAAMSWFPQPQNRHVETGIGYPTLMPAAIHCFESNAWMHYHAGKEGRHGKNYDWVIPNYFDLADWDPRGGRGGDYLAFLGRICEIKGLDTIRAIAEHSPVPIHLAGQGNPERWSHPNIVYRGALQGKARSDFLRDALAILAPSTFIEPFCGMTVEAQLCGTPVIAVPYGAMTETVQEGQSGFLCHTLRDWLEAIAAARHLDRGMIAARARQRWSLEACGPQYARMFRAVQDLSGQGWYSLGNDDAVPLAVAA